MQMTKSQWDFHSQKHEQSEEISLKVTLRNAEHRSGFRPCYVSLTRSLYLWKGSIVFLTHSQIYSVEV